ncbi:MAG: squalene synthase HpnC [Gammaproteobacteria bacterium]|nr:MAG: squalene synthase HpnC [Gammaproteobacteria bacterium]
MTMSRTDALLRRAATHYENFPVAPAFLPPRTRRALAAVYAFARTADDLADEGAIPPAERLARLDALAHHLAATARGDPPAEPAWETLAEAIACYRLESRHFEALLSAFRQDVTKHRYAHLGEVMDYCRRSANPVGRLVMAIAGDRDPRHLAWSDATCTALQWINFLQDLHEDLVVRDRIYLPADEMARFGVTERHLRERITDAAVCALLDHQLRRTRRILEAGLPLGGVLPGRLGLFVRTIQRSGLRVLAKLERPRTDRFDRPRLTRFDRLLALLQALPPGP